MNGAADSPSWPHEFAEREIRPVAWEYDGPATWPQEIIDKAWELGLMNAVLPAEYGGPGRSFRESCLIGEEFGWGCAGIGTSLSANGLGMMPLLLGGTESLKHTYLRRLAEAPRLASFCLTEPGAGSDASAITTTARRKGRGWVITGTKCFITNASYADWYTVFARTDGQAGTRGISVVRRSSRRWRPRRRARRPDRTARIRHRDDLLSRRRGAARPPDRRGGPGLRARDALAGSHPHRRGGAGDRPGARGDGVRDRPRQHSRAVRQAARRQSGDPD